MQFLKGTTLEVAEILRLAYKFQNSSICDLAVVILIYNEKANYCHPST